MDFSAQFAQVERLIAAEKCEEAKAVLRSVLAEDKRNAEAWYLASRCMDEPKAKAEALRRALLSNPAHPQAKRDFEAMKGMEVLRPPSATIAISKPARRASHPLLLLIGIVCAMLVAAVLSINLLTSH